MALAALAALVLITAAWWALALWPLPDRAPEWLARARAACFGSTPSGLPDASGWLLLLGQPAGMFAVLFLVWGRSVVGGLRRLAAARGGRASLAACCAGVLAGAAVAGLRVAEARAGARSSPLAAVSSATGAVRLDAEAPPLELTDQRGRTVTLASLRGRPLFLAFAYGRCETVCPLTVREVLRARRLAADLAPAVVVVTLDPWRDTPARLPHVAARWGLGADGLFLLGGPPAAVERALAAWGVQWDRNARTGEIVHSARVFVVDREGRLAYAAPPSAVLLAELARRP